MSSIGVAALGRMSREQLSSLLLANPIAAASAATSSDTSKIAVIDVRDSDYIGGHIRGCTNVPSNTLDYRMPELVRTLQDKDTVVFHCALSQQRGPSAALRYLRERARLSDIGEKEEVQAGAEGTGQKVFVLDGGFTKWQEKYGEDERLTEGYQKDIWEFGY